MPEFVEIYHPKTGRTSRVLKRGLDLWIKAGWQEKTQEKPPAASKPVEAPVQRADSSKEKN